jgi:ABC-type branched-subunit amino acid transport system substrate-binding protein
MQPEVGFPLRGRTLVVTVAVMGLLVSACASRLSDRELAAGDVANGSLPAPTSGPANPASDTGVTASEIRVGVVASKSSVLGPDTFSAPMYGAIAYFQSLNARGGVNGRTVRVIQCDDGGTGAGNRQCMTKLIDDDKVFAFAGNSILDYAGAAFVNNRAVPDIGGQPIGTAYDQYRHLYEIYGTSSPRDGHVGFNGTLYGGTEVYRHFKETLNARVAAVVYYSQADSERFADLTARGLEAEGFTVAREQVDFALPNFAAAAIDMRSRHVDLVFDALDSAGNVRLCAAMDAARVEVKAKVVTVQGWDESPRTAYAQSPKCRNLLYATGTDRNYMDTQYPVVAQFRSDMRAAFPDREARLSMWTVEGWASAQWLTDAVGSCGAILTRRCVESFMDNTKGYDGHGLLIPRDFTVDSDPAKPYRNCLNVAEWQDSAYGGKGGWVTRVPDMMTNCYQVQSIPYTP